MLVIVKWLPGFPVATPVIFTALKLSLACAFHILALASASESTECIDPNSFSLVVSAQTTLCAFEVTCSAIKK